MEDSLHFLRIIVKDFFLQNPFPVVLFTKQADLNIFQIKKRGNKALFLLK